MLEKGKAIAMMTKSKVKKLREKIEALSGAVSDEEIIDVAELLPKYLTKNHSFFKATPSLWSQ